MRVLKRNGFTTTELFATVERVSAERYGRNVQVDTFSSDRNDQVERFKLRTVASGDGKRGGTCAPGARRSAPPAYAGGTARRTVSACWHAHRDILRALFQAHPQATIISAMARYEGLAGFEATFPDTAWKNIGSIARPAYMPDLCECDDDGS
jgi:hypothetical protein